MSNILQQAERYKEHLAQIDPIRVNGKVTQVIGLTV
jgi:flagellum-specific ATP synthase